MKQKKTKTMKKMKTKKISTGWMDKIALEHLYLHKYAHKQYRSGAGCGCCCRRRRRRQ